MAIYIKKYNGSAWVDAAVNKWSGTAWVQGKVNKWNGSNWVQIYPESAVSTTQTISGGSTTTTYTFRADIYKNWKQEDAKQGLCTYADGDSKNYGYLNLASSKFTGYGNVNSLSSASYTGTRGGAGSYNTNQTIRFYRGSVVPTAGGTTSPASTVTGQFTSTTGGPGSGGAISARAISGTAECMNWMNGVGSKNKLYIYATSATDYLSLRGASSVKATYTYLAASALFLSAESTPMTTRMLSRSNLTSTDIYHEMLLYPGEENMNFQEIMARREELNLGDIPYHEINPDYETQICMKDVSVDNDRITYRLEYMKDGHVPEYSIDGTHYYPMQSDDVDIYYGLFNDKDFNPYMNNIYVRVRNEITDTIDFEHVHEPLIQIA